MKEITNWENANEEVLTNEEQEEKEAVLIDSVDEKTDDVFAKLLAEIADEKSDANDESNDSNESNEDSDEYEDDDTEDDSDEKPVVATSDESEEKPKKGLSRGQNIALIAIGAILALLLIWLFLNALGLFRTDDYTYTGGNNTDSVVVIPSDTDKDDDADKVITDGKENDNNGDVNKGNGNNDDDKNTNNGNDDQKNQNGNSGDDSNKDDSSDKNNDSNNGDDSGKNDNSQNGDNDSDGKNNSNNSDDKNTEDSDGDDTSDGDNDNGNADSNGNDGNQNGNDDAASDYAGETKVRISTVNDGTGIITISIGDSSVSVPVQTTVFNGRVTKSGVAQGKLFGYNSGVTVLLYYPQEDGFSSNEVTGFMNRSKDGLTILVDINGDGSKLLIKVNGMKSMF
jgi:hypothetical protein